VVRGRAGGAPVRDLTLRPLPSTPYKIGCKVGLHNIYIHSVASHSWCQITPLIQSYIIQLWKSYFLWSDLITF